MPSRMFSDRAWLSDKLRDVKPDEFKAEYAWIYSLAECDGTFECDPQKVWARCYAAVRQTTGRGGWTVELVAQLLDELAQRGLLLRQTDADGKSWGYWVGCEPLLPQLSHRAKFKKGKKHLFKVDANGMPMVCQTDTSDYRGLGLGVGLGVGRGVGAPPAVGAANSLPTVGDAFDEHTSEKTDTSERNGILLGQPGYYRKGQYPGSSAKDVWRHCAHIWANRRGDGAYCPMPTKFKDGNDPWKNLCTVTDCDLIVPAFELWVEKEGKYFKTLAYPLGEFMKGGTYQKYLALISPLNETTPKISKDDIAKTYAIAKAQHAKTWGLNETEAVSTEPGPEAFLED